MGKVAVVVVVGLRTSGAAIGVAKRSVVGRHWSSECRLRDDGAAVAAGAGAGLGMPSDAGDRSHGTRGTWAPDDGFSSCRIRRDS